MNIDDVLKIANPEGKEIITPTDLLEARKRLINRFGSKIVGKPKASWTSDEKVAQIAYETLTKHLHKSAPGTELPDAISHLYIKNEVNGAFSLLLKYAVKAFWVILAVSILLAILKYLNS